MLPVWLARPSLNPRTATSLNLMATHIKGIMGATTIGTCALTRAVMTRLGTTTGLFGVTLTRTFDTGMGGVDMVGQGRAFRQYVGEDVLVGYRAKSLA